MQQDIALGETDVQTLGASRQGEQQQPQYYRLPVYADGVQATAFVALTPLGWGYWLSAWRGATAGRCAAAKAAPSTIPYPTEAAAVEAATCAAEVFCGVVRVPGEPATRRLDRASQQTTLALEV
jgi:hypothetical protein